MYFVKTDQETSKKEQLIDFFHGTNFIHVKSSHREMENLLFRRSR